MPTVIKPETTSEKTKSNILTAKGKIGLASIICALLSVMLAAVLFTGTASGVFALTPMISILITFGSALAMLLLIAVGTFFFMLAKYLERDEESWIAKQLGSLKSYIRFPGIVTFLYAAMLAFNIAYAWTGSALLAFLPGALLPALLVLIISLVGACNSYSRSVASRSVASIGKKIFNMVKSFFFHMLGYGLAIGIMSALSIYATYSAIIVGSHGWGMANFILTIIPIGLLILVGVAVVCWVSSSEDNENDYDETTPLTYDVETTPLAYTSTVTINRQNSRKNLEENPEENTEVNTEVNTEASEIR